MEIRQLKTFQMVASTMSFSQAAASLSYAQSTVTAQIQALEEELGVPLFNRLGRTISLTESGTHLLEYAHRLIALEEEARATISTDAPSGVLNIAAPETVLTYRLPRILRAFRDRYPQVQVMIRPHIYRELFGVLRDGRVDLVFLIEESVHAPTFCVEKLVEEEMVLVMAPDHPLTHCENALSPVDLHQETLLLTEPGCRYRHLFEHTLHSAGVKPSAHLEFYSVGAIKQCAGAGLGVALLPVTAVESELASGALAIRHWNANHAPFYTQMVWHQDRWRSPALDAFMNVTHELIASPQPAS